LFMFMFMFMFMFIVQCCMLLFYASASLPLLL
jgi:hypothetical protein